MLVLFPSKYINDIIICDHIVLIFYLLFIYLFILNKEKNTVIYNGSSINMMKINNQNLSFCYSSTGYSIINTIELYSFLTIYSLFFYYILLFLYVIFIKVN
jgi:hypothetical protein